MTVAPAPGFPEKFSPVFERTQGSEKRFSKGNVRFYEGVATDTDVPSDFARGAYQDTAPANGRLAVPAAESVFKRAEDTMKERAHVGSASWVEAPQVLSDFVTGTVSGDRRPEFEYAYNSGAHQNRPSRFRVSG